MGGETNLTTLLGSLSANLAEGVFVFATLPGQHVPNGVSPRMMFQEAEGVTLILRREEAIAQGLEFEFPSRMITPMSCCARTLAIWAMKPTASSDE